METLKCMILAAILLWLSSPCILGEEEEDCKSLALSGDCEFYLCLDRLMGGCGPEKYPMGFGYKYCKRFLEHKHYFNKEGQEWIDNVRQCLMKKLVEGNLDHMTHHASSCDELAYRAYDSHPICYVECGFCEEKVGGTCANFMGVVKTLITDGDVLAQIGFLIAGRQAWGVLKECPLLITTSFILCPISEAFEYVFTWIEQLFSS